jgi:rSAM/selenodomain-associated transferase 2
VHDGAEVVVVDGGSHDGTPQLVQELGLRCIASARGRSLQMNAGAAAACGDWLAFLHADTVAGDSVLLRLQRIARESRPCWGRFDVTIDDAAVPFRVIESAMNLRSRITRIATGDQLIFVHRELFRAAGGFPPVALMEDVALSTALRALGPARCCRERVLVSPRRWRRGGVLRTIVLMWWLRARFALGADPEALARSYRASETDA